MDIHRCRFVSYPPPAINALAFSHPSTPLVPGKGPSTLRLAIGRANGDIEIWNPLKGAWFQETILRGARERTVEGLVWTQDPDEDDSERWKGPGRLRLFSIGYSAAVTEWDLEKGRVRRGESGGYSEAWCLAAQPRMQAGKDQGTKREWQHLAVGCADGAVVLLSTADGELRFLRTLTRPSTKRARVLSITFQNRDVVIAGYADSTIRAFDIRNGQLLRSMSLGAGPAGGPREILVWSVKCLPDGTIVSGDSTGELRFWNGNNFTLVQRLKSHVADILDIAVSADGESVVSGGMDRRTTIYKRIGSGKKGDRRRWAESSHKRFHTHDVKVMATFETKSLRIVASGGLDTTPIIIPFREFGKEYYRTLSSLPQPPQVQSAPTKRLLMSWWDREVNIWRIYGSSNNIHDSEALGYDTSKRTRKLVARIVLKGEENITSSYLSADGSLLAVSTISEMKLFRLKQRKTEGADTLRVAKIDTPLSTHNTGAKLISFSPDANWLVIIDTNNSVRAFRIVKDQSSKNGIRIISKAIDLKRIHRERGKQSLQHGSLGNYDRTIIRVAFSDDSRILVVGDLSGYLDSWVLEGHEDLTQDADTDVQDERSSSSSDDDESSDEEQPTVILGQHWIRNPAATLLPKLPSAPLILSFRPSVPSSTPPMTNGNTAVHPTRHNPHPHSHDLPSGEDRLFALTCEHHIYEFEILKGSLSDWSRRNPTHLLPANFREVRDRAMGCFWDLSQERQRLWLYGSGWLWMFDLARDFPPSAKRDEASRKPDGTNASINHRKRKMEERDTEGEDLRKHDSGAGGRVRESEIGTGIGRKMRKTIGPESTESQWTSLDAPSSPDSEEDEDGATTSSAMTGLRRGTGEIKANGGHNAASGDDAHVPDDSAAIAIRKSDEAPGWWCTYKYRPILGIVPIGTAAEADGGERQSQGQGLDDGPVGIEVAIVERPMWDVDLPPRYYGDQEWEK